MTVLFSISAIVRKGVEFQYFVLGVVGGDPSVGKIIYMNLSLLEVDRMGNRTRTS